MKYEFRMQPLMEYRLALGGYETRVLELEGDGPALVMFHGYADSADTWRRVLAHLAEAGRRAVAVDMPGFGAAARLARDELVLPQLDRFVAATIEHFATESGTGVVAAGNSLGGCVTLRAAQRDDLPLKGIVPIAPAGFDHPVWFQAIEATRVIRYILGAPIPLPEAIVRRGVGEAYRQLAFAHPRKVEREVINAFTIHHRTQRDVRRYLATGRRLIAELNQPFELERITVPVLLVWGDRDRMVTHRGARHILQALPETRMELLEDIGHCPQVEASGRVAELVADFSAEAVAQAA